MPSSGDTRLCGLVSWIRPQETLPEERARRIPLVPRRICFDAGRLGRVRPSPGCSQGAWL